MDNNDVLIRVRYALDLKNSEMVEIFQLGGVEVGKLDVVSMLKKSQEDDEETLYCDDETLEAFLNGLIVYKRGPQETKPGETTTQLLSQSEPINNIILKKLKIALQLTSEDMLDIFDEARIHVSKGELGAVLRKQGHRNYKECGDRYVRNFLKGLAIKYRGV